MTTTIPDPPAPTVADQLDRLAGLVARQPAGATLPMRPVTALVGLVREVAVDAGRPVPRAVGPDAPAVVVLRLAGVLAVRTAGHHLPLAPEQVARAARLWAAIEGRPVPVAAARRPSSDGARSDLIDVA